MQTEIVPLQFHRQEPLEMARILLEEPNVLIISLGVMASILTLLAYPKRQQYLLITAIGLVVLAITTGMISMLVVTDREQIIARTRAFVAATSPVDSTSLEDLMSATIELHGSQNQLWQRGRAPILHHLNAVTAKFNISRQTLQDLHAQVESKRTGLSAIQLHTKVEVGGFIRTITTTWILQWQLGDDNCWRMMSIRWRDMDGHEPRQGFWH